MQQTRIERLKNRQLQRRNHSLAHQVQQVIHKYDSLAKNKGYQCLNTGWVKKTVHLTSQKWSEIKAGSPLIHNETFQHVLGVIKQAWYELDSKPKRTTAYSNVTVVKGLNQKLSNHEIQQKEQTAVPHGNKAFQRFMQTHPVVEAKQDHGNTESRVITQIIPQKKHKKRYNVYLHNHYAFPVSEDVLVQFRLHHGQYISPTLQKQITSADNTSKLFNTALNYISRYSKTEKQVRDKLHKYSHNDYAIQQAIQKLKNLHLLDDKAFAKHFVSDKAVVNHDGPSKIREKLYQKGLSNENIEYGLQFYNQNQQLKHAEHLAKEKFSNYQRKYAYTKCLQKIKLALMRKGYDTNIASTAIQNNHFTIDSKIENALLQKKYQIAKDRYKRYNKKPYQYQMKVKQYLVRQGFSFDEIDSIMS